MVVDEVGIIQQWLRSLEVTPTIVALRTRAEDIKRSEVEKAIGRLAHLSPQERELVEGMASSIVNKLIHHTMVTLKTEVASADGAAFVEAARRFFNLTDAELQRINGSAANLLKDAADETESAQRTGGNTP
jgi:glutamyl-tRNA reductase